MIEGLIFVLGLDFTICCATYNINIFKNLLQNPYQYFIIRVQFWLFSAFCFWSQLHWCQLYHFSHLLYKGNVRKYFDKITRFWDSTDQTMSIVCCCIVIIPNVDLIVEKQFWTMLSDSNNSSMDASPARSPIMPSPRSPKTENKIQLRPVDTKWFFSADDDMMAEYAKQNPERFVESIIFFFKKPEYWIIDLTISPLMT